MGSGRSGHGGTDIILYCIILVTDDKIMSSESPKRSYDVLRRRQITARNAARRRRLWCRFESRSGSDERRRRGKGERLAVRHKRVNRRRFRPKGKNGLKYFCFFNSLNCFRVLSFVFENGSNLFRFSSLGNIKNSLRSEFEVWENSSC